MFDLTGRVALVCGAGQNMGRAVALAFAEAWSDLLICDYRAETLEWTTGEIAALGRRVVPVRCDVSDIGQIRAMFARLDDEFGRIDILANIPGNNHLSHPEDLPIEKVQEVLQGALVGKLCACQEGGRRMLRAGNQHGLDRRHHRARARQLRLQRAMGGVAQMTRRPRDICNPPGPIITDGSSQWRVQHTERYAHE